jgi:hypothetical protein
MEMTYQLDTRPDSMLVLVAAIANINRAHGRSQLVHEPLRIGSLWSLVEDFSRWKSDQDRRESE